MAAATLQRIVGLGDVANYPDFRVLANELGYLILPHPSKHIWKESERLLRSLLVTPAGVPLSSGFPKFFNYGENALHDKWFTQRWAEGAVTITEKLDGSLIIIDKLGPYEVHLRTRGNWCLGPYEKPIHDLLHDRYSSVLPSFLGGDTQMMVNGQTIDFNDYSFLFEYVGPENRIILEYDEPMLFLIGMVHKQTVKIEKRQDILNAVAIRLKVPRPVTMKASGTLPELIDIIRTAKNREGVVVSFEGPDGDLWLLKLKSQQYLKLHSMKFSMTPEKAQTLAYLLGVKQESEILAKLSPFGIDAEMVQYVLPAIRTYLARRFQFDRAFHALEAVIAEYRPLGLTRKEFVFKIQDFLKQHETHYPDSHWFAVSMKSWDGDREAAQLAVHAMALEIPVTYLSQLVAESPSAIKAMTSFPVDEEGDN